MASEALTFVLRSGRDAFNARFAAARRLYPDLRGESFRTFLETTVDPLAQAVQAVSPERVPEVVMAAYDLGLELVGKHLVGAGARHDLIERGWRALGQPAAPLVARAPGKVLAAVSNALHQLGETPGARPEQWIADLVTLSPACPDAETLLKVGQVRAWMAGLAHYRTGALAVCDTLPESLAMTAVGATGAWPAVRERLLRDPWFVPARGPEDPGPGAQAVGDFRGFGGLFRTPPRIASRHGQLIVTCGEDCWVLTADAFGATFHPASAEERANDFSVSLPAGVRVSEGKVSLRGRAFAARVAGDITSVAADGLTLAITSSLTHAIVLVGMTSP